ncbi:actin-like ATPase domain-containing protein [Basidiobolus meristosporus CBS 931.73]|uniref:Phosphotransferase n=1 Tax=Basidiobolus meristosporus CBS 931.73 TaxID=1314790 RepID=A0A1Y1XZZ7_9FUNG|nr:actin-like ATPase domain-containing protein [Basidiobolus meristosporus CBS 931.73]|eukprot:ORX91333.1 actin-like ATPase domain-containing protein [Basidiobolus meristosporus CBS 931.73]
MSKFQEIESLLTISPDGVKSIASSIVDDLEKGLTHTDPEFIGQIPSFVTSLPTGKETGTYLAIDLGGTNLRTAAVTLLGDGQVGVNMRKYAISTDIREGEGTKLFDWIADCTAELLQDTTINVGTANLHMGVTFSFALNQTAINRGTVGKMGKGFNLTGVQGNDLKDLLEDGFKRKGLDNIIVSAIINDTVGTLVSHAYVSPTTKIGLILATGTNAAYLESGAKIAKYQGAPVDQMILNTEYNTMAQNTLPYTKYDDALDNETFTPGFQRLEKMVSGMYMGEIARRVMIDLCEHDELFGGKTPQGLETPYGFKTLFMSTIESDPSPDHPAVEAIFEKHFPIGQRMAAEDKVKIHRICKLIATRSACIVGASIAALLLQANNKTVFLDKEETTTIGIDGSVYEFYPYFSQRIRRAIEVVLGPERVARVKLELARDGGCIGSALVAMVASTKQAK